MQGSRISHIMPKLSMVQIIVRLKLLYMAHCTSVTCLVSSPTQLHDIIILQHCLVTSVRRPMCCNVVQTAAGWESNAGLQALGLDELAHCVFQCFTHVRHIDARLDDAPHVLPHLHVSSNVIFGLCLLLLTLLQISRHSRHS